VDIVVHSFGVITIEEGWQERNTKETRMTKLGIEKKTRVFEKKTTEESQRKRMAPFLRQAFFSLVWIGGGGGDVGGSY